MTIGSANNGSSVTTTDNTLTGALSLEHPTDPGALHVDLTVLARRASNNNVKTWRQTFVVENVAGALSVVTGVIDIVAPYGDLGAATWLVSVDVSGSQPVIQVKGQNGAEIVWAVRTAELWIDT